jgi:hypothetical protein
MGAGAEECARYEQAFNQLARFLLQRHGGPDAMARRVEVSVPRGLAPLGELSDDALVARLAAADPSGKRRLLQRDGHRLGPRSSHWQRFLPVPAAWRISYGSTRLSRA